MSVVSVVWNAGAKRGGTAAGASVMSVVSVVWNADNKEGELLRARELLVIRLGFIGISDHV
jgi:hypothetical protein